MFGILDIHRRHIIVEEEDVTRMIKIINRNLGPKTRYADKGLGSCGWVDSRKWFINFYSTNKEWNVIRRKLKVIRTYTYSEIPDGTHGIVYSTD